VDTIVFSAVLIFTIITSLAIGIFSAYGFIHCLLVALAPGRRSRKRLGPVLVPTQNHASGD
jgi:hypothetical protein